MDVKLIANLNDFKLMEKFKSEVRKNIIENGLDKQLSKDLRKLKKRLFNIINIQIREGVTEPTKAQQKTEEIDIPKSDSEILKYLTGVDIEKFNKTKDYSTFTESSVAFGQYSKNISGANRLRLRLDMTPGETFDSQLYKARSFFNKAIFAIPDSSGQLRYYVNPGINMDHFVKVVCSDRTVAEDNIGKSTSRFDRVTSKHNYSEWTMLQKDIEEVVVKRFNDITETINKIKVGEVEEALSSLNAKKSNPKLEEIKTKVADIQDNQKLDPSMQAYTNLVKMVKFLKIKKQIKKETVTYTLITTQTLASAETQDIEKNFNSTIKTVLSRWKIQNEDIWFNTLVKLMQKEIRRFERMQSKGTMKGL